jgi:hypothetical protein
MRASVRLQPLRNVALGRAPHALLSARDGCSGRGETCGRGRAQLPASFFAYRKQQHRWTCGPVQLWRRAAPDIWRSGLPLGTKLELLLLHFGVRKFATHWVSLGFFCTLVPLSMFTPEVRAWANPARLQALSPARPPPRPCLSRPCARPLRVLPCLQRHSCRARGVGHALAGQWPPACPA